MRPRSCSPRPRFFGPICAKRSPTQLRSLRLLITGAEKLPTELAHAFEERFGLPVYEGYGLTETSPVVSVNLPNPQPRAPGDSVQPSHCLGSTGKMAPGIAAEIRDPETDERLSLHETGMLWLRGPNIFSGYLNDPVRSTEVLHDGWFKTGDLGRFDEDGFLFIEGRLSRFSKIAGEMVPHELIEQKILAALKLDAHSERVIAIMGVPDEAKGEAIVLLSSVEIDLPQLRDGVARRRGAESLGAADRAAGGCDSDPRLRQARSRSLQRIGGGRLVARASALDERVRGVAEDDFILLIARNISHAHDAVTGLRTRQPRLEDFGLELDRVVRANRDRPAQFIHSQTDRPTGKLQRAGHK